MFKKIRHKISDNTKLDFKKGGLYTFINPYSYFLLKDELDTLNRFDRIYVDGISLVVLFKIFKVHVTRVSFDMTSIARGVFQDAILHNKSIYFIGTKAGVIDHAVENILKDYPVLNILGFRHGYFDSKQDRADFLKQLIDIKPDIVVVGMGTPLQEEFLIELKDEGWNGTGFTCGGFLHQTAKNGTQYYPDLINKLNLRWLYRIFDEPALFFRYLKYYPISFLYFFYDAIHFRSSKKGNYNKSLVILGIRGVPARYGGFETFAEQLCLYLISRNWKVTVYCQEVGHGPISESNWEGVKRIHIPVRGKSPMSAVIFDLKSIIHSIRQDGIFLTLGYNTALFNILHRIFRKVNIINMDGFEWKRKKWGFLAKNWLWLNERCGCWFASHLIADHPQIAKHLATRVSDKKITMISYGGRDIIDAEESILQDYGIKKNEYALVIARPEPENSILEIVSAFSEKARGAKLIVLGTYDSVNNAYHRAIYQASSDEVVFLGSIYEHEKVGALRFFARVYVHGHQVGGTNPSLVEALAAGNAVVAHDNDFNRWVAKDSAIYFDGEASASKAFDQIFINDDLIESLKGKARENFNKNFQWETILSSYERLLLNWQAY